LALYPDNVYAVALLGQAYLALERTEKARETAERALALDPNSPEAWYLLARVRRLVDFDLEGAAEDFRTAYDLAPNRLDIAVELAYVYWSMQDYDAGIALLTGIIDNNPNNTQALYAAGFIYNSGIGSPQLASEPLQQCITVDDQNIDCLYYYGRALFALGAVRRCRRSADPRGGAGHSACQTQPTPLLLGSTSLHQLGQLPACHDVFRAGI
jgi:tetratricopeptide (TPR) repeat protein